MPNPFDQFGQQKTLPEVVPRNPFDHFDTKETEQAELRQMSANPLRWLLGAGETALGMGTGMVTTPINEAIAAGADFQAGGETGEQYLEDPAVGMYQPRTSEGRAISEWLGTVLSPVGKAIDFVSNPTGDKPVGEHSIKALLGILPVRAPIARKSNRPRAPEIDDLKRASQAAYREAERGSGVVAQSSLGKFTNKAEQMLANEGVDATLHPSTMAAYTRLLDDSTKPGIAGHSLKGLEVNRRVLAAAEGAAKGGSDDARLAGKLLDEFDDYVDSLTPADLVGGVGDANVAARNYAQARELWARMRKAQTVEGLVERARNASPSLTQSGLENALRLEFKSLANNPRRMRHFTPEERQAITRIVRGTAPQNIARYTGKLAVRGPVSGGVTVGGGMALGGPFLAGALAGVGEAGKLAATLMRLGDVNRVRELVRMGPQQRIQQINPRLQQLGYIPPTAMVAPGLAERSPAGTPETAVAPAETEADRRRRLLAEQMGGR